MKDITQLDPVALRTLAVAVRLGTFEAAARELHVTPSAVSQRIKALETRIGRVLLHRVKPLEPTEAGRVLVRLATQTELLEREAVAATPGVDFGANGTDRFVRFAYTRSMAELEEAARRIRRFTA